MDKMGRLGLYEIMFPIRLIFLIRGRFFFVGHGLGGWGWIRWGFFSYLVK